MGLSWPFWTQTFIEPTEVIVEFEDEGKGSESTQRDVESTDGKVEPNSAGLLGEELEFKPAVGENDEL